MVYAGRILYETDNDDIPYCPRKRLLRLSTFTCFTCDYYYDHPQAVLSTRITILTICLLFRLIAFVLGATCANRYPPRAIAYTVFAALSFLPSIATMILEHWHRHRLWHYFPDGNETVKRSDNHVQFLPYSIINDQRTSSWHSSLCTRPKPCPSRNLYHILLYHSGSTQYNDDDAKTLVGFHQTDQTGAFGISREGFIESDKGMLGPGVYFATCIEHTEFKANHRGAYICARVKVGNVKKTKSRIAKENAKIDCDTLYFEHPHGSHEFCVKKPERIEEWIIVVNQDDNIRTSTEVRDNIKDRFYGETYTGCIY